MAMPSSESDRIGETRLIRRDLDCLQERGALGRLSQVELDRHTLVVLLGLTRAQLARAEQDRDLFKRRCDARDRLLDEQSA